MIAIAILRRHKRKEKERKQQETIKQQQQQIAYLQQQQGYHQPIAYGYADNTQAPVAAQGRQLLAQAYQPDIQYLELTFDHDVDENAELIKKHGVISAKRGERVILIKGDLKNGLGSPYQDYVEVKRLSDDKIGKISRKVLRVV